VITDSCGRVELIGMIRVFFIVSYSIDVFVWLLIEDMEGLIMVLYGGYILTAKFKHVDLSCPFFRFFLEAKLMDLFILSYFSSFLAV